MTSLAPGAWPPGEPPPELPERPPGAGPPARRPDGADAWQPWAAPLALVGGFVAALVGGLIVAIAAVPLGADFDEDTAPGVLLGATAAQDVALVGAAIVCAAMFARPSAPDFGFRRARVWRAVGATLLVYVAFIAFAGAWSQVVEIPEDEELLRDLGVDEGTHLLVLGALLVCVGAPLVEEFFFRGFFYRALRNWRGAIPAALLTGAVFGAIHFGSSDAAALLPLAVLGVGLCLLYEWTGSLYPCIALHAINNSIAFGIAKDWGWEILPLMAGSLLLCALVSAVVARSWRPRPGAAATPVAA